MTAIYDWFGYDIPIKERYRFIKEAGFDGVLMWWSEYLGRNDYRGGVQIAREADLFIENIHAPFQVQNYIWLDNADGEAAVDCYLQCIADCAEFEIPTMVVHLPDDEKPYNTLGIDRMKKMTEKAEQLGVNIALENLNNLKNLTYVLAQVDSPRIGLCYDNRHHDYFASDVDLLSMYGSRLMAIHLHDDKNGAPHKLPFDGSINWAATMKSIAKTGYTGTTAIEVMNWGYEHLSAEEFVREAFARAQKLEMLRTINQ